MYYLRLLSNRIARGYGNINNFQQLISGIYTKKSTKLVLLKLPSSTAFFSSIKSISCLPSRPQRPDLSRMLKLQEMQARCLAVVRGKFHLNRNRALVNSITISWTKRLLLLTTVLLEWNYSFSLRPKPQPRSFLSVSNLKNSSFIHVCALIWGCGEL